VDTYQPITTVCPALQVKLAVFFVITMIMQVELFLSTHHISFVQRATCQPTIISTKASVCSAMQRAIVSTLTMADARRYVGMVFSFNCLVMMEIWMTEMDAARPAKYRITMRAPMDLLTAPVYAVSMEILTCYSKVGPRIRPKIHWLYHIRSNLSEPS